MLTKKTLKPNEKIQEGDFVECIGPMGQYGWHNWEKTDGISMGKIYKVINVLETGSAIMVKNDKDKGEWYSSDFFSSNLGFKGIIQLAIYKKERS